MKNKILNLLLILFIILFMTITVIYPKQIIEGAFDGLIICGNILIPSLFPFTLCSLFLLKSNAFIKIFSKAEKVSLRLFGMNTHVFSCFIMSFIGGYPIGAKLLNELLDSGKISKKDSSIFLCCFINAGPAFIVSAIGTRVLNSTKAGIILLFSHFTATLIITLISGRFTEKTTHPMSSVQNDESIIDRFILCASDASNALINISAFVIFFSAINAALECISDKIFFIKYITYFTEVTSACTKTDNIFFISFLLGFSGICIWCQVFSSAKSLKKNFLLFIAIRITHGIISTLLTYILLKVFPVKESVISNAVSYNSNCLYSTVTLSSSLILMGILLIISLQNKNNGRNILKDMI